MIFKWDMCSDGVKFGPSLGVTNESKYLLFPLAIATITNTNSENKNIFNIDIICLICKLLYVSMYFFSYWETTDTISEPTYQYLYPRILPHSGRYPHLSFQIEILPWIPLDLWRFLRHRNGLEVHRSIGQNWPGIKPMICPWLFCNLPKIGTCMDRAHLMTIGITPRLQDFLFYHYQIILFLKEVKWYLFGYK